MLDTWHRRLPPATRPVSQARPGRWWCAQPASSSAPHCPHVTVVVVGQAALTRREEAVLPAGKAPLWRSDGVADRSLALRRAPGRPTLPDGGAGGGGLHAAGAEVGDGGDARRGSRRASQLPRAAVSGAAFVIRAPRHDRPSALLSSLLSCLVWLGFAQVSARGGSGREGRRGRGGQSHGGADTLRNRRLAAPPPRLVPSTPSAPPCAARPR